MSKQKLTYFIGDHGACGLYRLDNPLLAVKKSGDAAVYRVNKGDSILDNIECLKADIFVMPRLFHESMLNVIKKLQNEGKKLVIDYDDNMFNVMPLTSAYKEFGTEEVQYKFPDGNIVDLWVDGKNINIKENKQKIEGIKKALGQADLVTVTTDILAEAYREYNPNVVALPNCVDMSLWQKLPLKRETDEIRLFWTGGDSHYGDLMLLPEVLKAIMDKYKNVKFVTFGAHFQAALKNLPSDRLEHHGWIDPHAYPYKAAILNPDIALIPLEDTVFNKCKSNIKWVEMSSMDVPCVTSLVSPYKEYAKEDNGVFIEDNDKDAWIDGISYLIDNPDKRVEFAKNAKQTVKDKFDITTQYHRWTETYKNIPDKEAIMLQV